MTFEQQLDLYLRARCTLIVVVTVEVVDVVVVVFASKAPISYAVPCGREMPLKSIVTPSAAVDVPLSFTHVSEISSE